MCFVLLVSFSPVLYILLVSSKRVSLKEFAHHLDYIADKEGIIADKDAFFVMYNSSAHIAIIDPEEKA